MKKSRLKTLNNNDTEETILEAIRQNTCFWPLEMGIFITIENISSYFSDDHIKDEKFFEIAAKMPKKYISKLTMVKDLFFGKRSKPHLIH